MNKLLTVVAILLVLPYALSGQDEPQWGYHSFIWDYTAIDLEGDYGLTSTIDLKKMISGEDPNATLASTDGVLINYDYLKDKIVVIDFWFIRCEPCRKELPALELLGKMFPGKEVVILSICRDAYQDIQEYNLDHSSTNIHIIADAQTRLTNDQIFNYPYKVLVNRDGDIVYSFLGGKKTDTPVEDLVADLSQKINTLKGHTLLP